MITHKNNYRLIHRIITFALACLMVLSTTFSSFALGESATGNDVSGALTGAGGDFSANITNDYTSGKIGIRLSLVNRDNHEEIISVEDDGKTPRVVDVLYVTENAFKRQTGGEYNSPLDKAFTYNSVKTQTLSSRAIDGSPKIMWVYYDEISSLFPVANMPPWLAHNGAYYSNGKAFVDWCRQDDYGNTVLGGGAIYTTNAFGVPIDITIKVDEGEELTRAKMQVRDE